MAILAVTGCISEEPLPMDDPFKDPEILKITAIRQLKLEQVDQAVKTLRTARQIDPDDPELAQYLGIAYLQSGLAPEAAEVLSEAIENSPDKPELYDLRGLAYLEEGKFDLAARDLEHALDPALEFLAPPVTLSRLAKAYWGAGRTEDSIKAYRQAVVYQPRAPLPRIELVQALEQLGRTDQALKEAQQLVFLLPDYAPGHFLLGQTQLAAGQNAAAAASFRRNLTLDPESPNAPEARRYLEIIESQG